MQQAVTELVVSTRGRGLHEITDRVSDWVSRSGIATGLCTLFLRHTSASLLIQENADPDVQRDLDAFFASLVPDGHRGFIHTAEGPDDMPAHVRTALTSVQVSIPVTGGALALGTWQGLYVWEHRRDSHRRRVVLHLIGEPTAA
ncbi:MAG: secondary thiamine-phosphate synthase enzyme YjbQ [Verrucomicrobiae bacterium]|nr:secondary thiamine-phosphate synthase enzyme YjbQ [Verrucomicrobiae bacterium]